MYAKLKTRHNSSTILAVRTVVTLGRKLGRSMGAGEHTGLLDGGGLRQFRLLYKTTIDWVFKQQTTIFHNSGGWEGQDQGTKGLSAW